MDPHCSRWSQSPTHLAAAAIIACPLKGIFISFLFCRQWDGYASTMPFLSPRLEPTLAIGYDEGDLRPGQRGMSSMSRRILTLPSTVD